MGGVTGARDAMLSNGRVACGAEGGGGARGRELWGSIGGDEGGGADGMDGGVMVANAGGGLSSPELSLLLLPKRKRRECCGRQHADGEVVR